jgi:hypothetical protein
MGKLFSEFYINFMYKTNKTEITLNEHEKLAGNAHSRERITLFVDHVKGERENRRSFRLNGGLPDLTTSAQV